MKCYPAAERLAWDLPIESDDVDALVAVWADAYRDRHRCEPGPEETKAARKALGQRLAGAVPPLPPSASTSGSWRPCTEFGLQTDPDER